MQFTPSNRQLFVWLCEACSDIMCECGADMPFKIQFSLSSCVCVCWIPRYVMVWMFLFPFRDIILEECVLIWCSLVRQFGSCCFWIVTVDDIISKSVCEWYIYTNLCYGNIISRQCDEENKYSERRWGGEVFWDEESAHLIYCIRPDTERCAWTKLAMHSNSWNTCDQNGASTIYTRHCLSLPFCLCLWDIHILPNSFIG